MALKLIGYHKTIEMDRIQECEGPKDLSAALDIIGYLKDTIE